MTLLQVKLRPRKIRYCDIIYSGGSKGHTWHPQGSWFFLFNIQILQNIAMSGVGILLRGRHLLREILHLPLIYVVKIKKHAFIRSRLWFLGTWSHTQMRGISAVICVDKPSNIETQYALICEFIWAYATMCVKFVTLHLWGVMISR